MKKAIYLILFLNGFAGISQELKPDRIISSDCLAGKDCDTMICWKLSKARIIASELSHASYSDEIILEFENRETFTNLLLMYEKAEKEILLKERDNYNKIIEEKNKQTKLLEDACLAKDKNIRKLKKTSVFAIAVAVFFGVIATVK